MDFYGFTLLLRWILGWFIQPQLKALPLDSAWAEVAVIIPARNEENSLPILLTSLQTSTLQPKEIIVIDDHSTDKTYQVATSFGVKVIKSKELPQVWTGKTFALSQGVKHTTSPVLLFLDADTKPSQDLITKLVAVLNKNGGLVSVQPFHFMQSLYERFASVFNLVGAIGARLGEANGLAFGPVMMLKRQDLEKIGGIQSVKDQLLEDRALGLLFRKNNLSVTTFIGEKDVSFQMYPDGIKSLTQGFTKNMAAGSVGISKTRFLLLFTWFSGLAAAAWELPFAILAWTQTGVAPSLYQYCLTIGFGLQFWWFTRKLGNFNFYLILYPFMVLYFLVVFFYSVTLTWKGKVRWKDRTIDAKKGLK
jgi:glycosyltransferase involved in cell wall biosynthesis